MHAAIYKLFVKKKSCQLRKHCKIFFILFVRARSIRGYPFAAFVQSVPSISVISLPIRPSKTAGACRQNGSQRAHDGRHIFAFLISISYASTLIV